MRVRLPSDRMTNKQWKERCGDVFVCQTNSPMKWGEFKSLPPTMQKEYLSLLQERYNANATSFAEMFGIRPLTVRRFIAANDLGISFPVGRSMSKQQRSEWECFLGATPEDEDVSSAETESLEVEPIEQAPVRKPVLPTKMSRFSISFQGALDVQHIANSLQTILGDNSVGNIEIVCELA